MAYGRNETITDGSVKYGVAASGGSLVGGFIIEELVKGMASFYSGDLGAKEIKLRHSKTRLYDIVPNKKHDEINVALKDISIDCHPVSGSDFGDFVIKIPSKEKAYVYHNVYMPNRFYKSIMSAKSEKNLRLFGSFLWLLIHYCIYGDFDNFIDLPFFLIPMIRSDDWM